MKFKIGNIVHKLKKHKLSIFEVMLVVHFITGKFTAVINSS